MSSKIIAGTTSSTALNMSADTSGVLEIQTGATPTTAITVDASQNVGVGVTPTNKFQVAGNIAVGTGGWFKSASTSNYNGMYADESSNSLSLWTNNTQRLSIVSDGTTSIISSALNFNSPSGNAAFTINAQNAAGANPYIDLVCPGVNSGRIYYDRGTSRLYIYSQSGGVYLGATATSWTANSDERLKDIIEPITDATDKISSLRAVIGKYKTDEEGTRRSFLIAQDVQAAFPEAVDASNPDELGVQYSDVIPLLVASIKELNAKVTALEAQLGAK